MSTFEMLSKSIEAKKKRGQLTQEYIEDTEMKMDVFLMNDRITQDQYNELIKMLKVQMYVHTQLVLQKQKMGTVQRVSDRQEDE